MNNQLNTTVNKAVVKSLIRFVEKMEPEKQRAQVKTSQQPNSQYLRTKPSQSQK